MPSWVLAAPRLRAGPYNPRMGLWTRRTLALVGVLVALLLGPLAAAHAETASPTPTPSPTASGGAEPGDAPDVPLDETRTILMLAGAGALALLAGVVVFVRR